MKKDTNFWERISCPWIRKINIVKMFTLTKAIHRFNATSNKIPMAFPTKILKTILKFVWNHRRLLIDQSSPEEEEHSWRNFTLPDFKLYCKPTVIMAVLAEK